MITGVILVYQEVSGYPGTNSLLPTATQKANNECTYTVGKRPTYLYFLYNIFSLLISLSDKHTQSAKPKLASP